MPAHCTRVIVKLREKLEFIKSQLWPDLHLSDDSMWEYCRRAVCQTRVAFLDDLKHWLNNEWSVLIMLLLF